jgi:hypothetical protein
LDARALETDTGADRIDGVVLGDDRHLGPAAHLARDGADLDHGLGDFRHLELEERRHEHRISPRQDQAGTLGRLFQPLEDRANGVALVEMLPVVLLAIRDDGLRLAELVEHEHQLAPFDLLHFPGQQLADLVAEFLPDLGALALTHPLDDPLLGRLDRETPELGEGDFLFEDIAHLEFRVLEAGILDRDLGAGILHRLDHGPQPHDPHAALQLVHVQLEADVGAELPGQGGVNAVAQQFQEIGSIELFGRCQLAKRGQHFG